MKARQQERSLNKLIVIQSKKNHPFCFLKILLSLSAKLLHIINFRLFKKGKMSRDFFSSGTSWIIFPQALKITLVSFRIFSRIRGDALNALLVSTTVVSNLSPESTTSAVHLELRIFQRIFEKIRNGPNGKLRGLGKTDPWKNLMSKISWHCPFKLDITTVGAESSCRAESLCRNTCIIYFRHLELR